MLLINILSLCVSLQCLFDKWKLWQRALWILGFWLVPFLFVPLYFFRKYRHQLGFLVEPIGGSQNTSQSFRTVKYLLLGGIVLGPLGLVIGYLWASSTNKEKCEEGRFKPNRNSFFLFWRSHVEPLIQFGCLLWLCYIFLHLLKNPEYSTKLNLINIAIHEMGHLLFTSPSQIIVYLGGSLTEILVPVFCIWRYQKSKNYFISMLCVGWLAVTFYGVAIYVADAQARVLAKTTVFWGGVTPGAVNSMLDRDNHDWYIILSKLGVLEFDAFFASMLRFFGAVSMFVCVTGCLLLLWNGFVEKVKNV